MDLKLYFSVLWRFKFLVALGILFALALAVFSYAAPNFSGKGPMLEPRQSEQWVSYAELFVTPHGFPWGMVVDGIGGDDAKKSRDEAPAGDPNRLSNLAVLYSHMVTGDPVRKIILKGGPMHGEIDAAPVLAGDSNLADALPLIRIAAIADTDQHALQLVIRTSQAFKTFLTQEQEASGIAKDNRVRVTVLKRADKPQLLSGRSLTLPMVVFIAVMIMVSGLCFILENMRPRKRPLPVAAADEGALADARLTA